MTQRFLFLDTNIYLHAQVFGQIPWPEVAGADGVVIVVPRITIRELDDKKKDGRTKRIRSRAQKTTTQIVGLVEGDGSVRAGVRLEDYQRRPQVVFSDLDLDENESDDVLLATILTYKEEHPNRDVALVANDAGPRLKARGLGIELLPLPDKYMLEPELTDMEKKLREANTELARVKGAQPKLTLSFPGGTDHLALNPPPDPPTEEEILQAITNHRKKYSLKDKDPAAAVGALLGKFAADPDEIRRYREQLPQYLEEWDEWYRTEVERRTLEARVIEFVLELKNTGRKPANDTSVELLFPSGVKVARESDIQKPASEPRPPARPKSTVEQIRKGLDMSRIFGSLQPLPDVGGFLRSSPIDDIWAPETKRTAAGTPVILSAQKVQQGGDPIQLDRLYILPDARESFQIDYKIVCDELHEPTIASLHIVYEEPN